MNLENRMPLRRTLIPLMLLGALAAAASCADPSPMGVPAFQRGGKWSPPPTNGVGLVTCSQTYDSVTQVIGPAGGLIAVGNHFLWVDTMALSDTVSLQFRTNGAGWSALLYTSFKDCGVPTADTLKIAQVNDSLEVIRYLAPPDSTWIKVKKKAWSQGQQYVAGVLHHFSQYAVAW